MTIKGKKQSKKWHDKPKISALLLQESQSDPLQAWRKLTASPSVDRYGLPERVNSLANSDVCTPWEKNPSSITPFSVERNIVAPNDPTYFSLSKTVAPNEPTLTNILERQNQSLLQGNMTTVQQYAANINPFTVAPALQQATILPTLGVAIANGGFMVSGKSWQELEKEEREAEIKKLEQKYEERDKASLAEIKKVREESARINDQAKKTNDRLQKLEEERAQERTDYEKIKALLQKYEKSPQSIQTPRGEKKGLITFDRESGKIYIGKNFAGQLEPLTLDYSFFEILFDAADDTVAYVEITAKLGRKATGKAVPNYCHSIKTSIGKYAPDIAKLIQDFGALTQGKGYKLLCFGTQKKTRKSLRKT